MTESKVPGVFAFELDAKAEDFPDDNILTFENGHRPEETLTYSDIALKGRKVAGALQRMGIGKGDAFALVMPNYPEFVYALYAATAIGAVLVPIDPRAKGGRLVYQIRDSTAKGVIFSAEHMNAMAEVIRALPALKTIGVVYKSSHGVAVSDRYPSLNDVLDGSESVMPDPACADIQAPMEIIYTSGTTGNPKGVVIKSARMGMMAMMAGKIWKYGPDDKLYSGLSLTHGNAQAVTLIPSLFLNIPAVISRKFTKSRIWDICRLYGCTSFSLLGGMMMGIYSEPQQPGDRDNPVRLVLSAGTPVVIWQKFEQRFNVRIHEWYGAVEGGFAHNPPGTGPAGSFGKPPEELMEMKVVREDDTTCTPGEIGELVSRMKGQPPEVEYLGKKDASEAKTRGGWLRSGDMCHQDENGWFYFDFRNGGGLRRAGDFIMPEYVEAVLAEHPDVTDVCVYGIPAASGAPGESDLVAAVQPVDGQRIDPRSLFDACLGALEKNAVPSFLQIVAAIPKTTSEKNLSRLLREAFRESADNVYNLQDFI